jgi:signal transduction histidine kinase
VPGRGPPLVLCCRFPPSLAAPPSTLAPGGFRLTPLAVDQSALGFQTVVTLMLAVVHTGLWMQSRATYHAAWAAAWLAYAVRLVMISLFLTDRQWLWLFGHQAATGITALLLLWAALQFSQGLRWRWLYAAFPVVAVAWAWFGVMVVHDMALAGASGAIVLSAVTLWTGWVYWRYWRDKRSSGAILLAWTFWLWGLHHLDYPILRNLGVAVLWGVFADVLFIVVVALGKLSLVAGESRRALAARTAQLEQLTHLVLRAQEEERHRIARELHDEAGQALTAVKIELDLEGRREASDLVARVLDQIRDVSNLLRPSVLDDLGLEPALRALTSDFARRSGIEVVADLRLAGVACPPQVQVAIYRVVQEALTNVARHSGATRVHVEARLEDGAIELAIEDNGRGAAREVQPHMGLLGMRERVTELGGSFAVSSRPMAGFRIQVRLPNSAPDEQERRTTGAALRAPGGRPLEV